MLQNVNWAELAEQLEFRNRAFINGEFVESQTRQTFETINPATGKKITDVVRCETQDVDILITGGQRVTVGDSNCYIQPTIFDGVNSGMTIAREEIFGPVLSVMTFRDEDEAVAMANDSIYGLAASIWTSNLKRAHRLARKIRAGTISVNTVDALDPMTPFGGFKQSGFGRDLSLHALDKFSQLKTTWIILG